MSMVMRGDQSVSRFSEVFPVELVSRCTTDFKYMVCMLSLLKINNRCVNCACICK
jgi:hypothetical protein